MTGVADSSDRMSGPNLLRQSLKKTYAHRRSLLKVGAVPLTVYVLLALEIFIGFLPYWETLVKILTTEAQGSVRLHPWYEVFLYVLNLPLVAAMLAAVAITYREKVGLPEGPEGKVTA